MAKWNDGKKAKARSATGQRQKRAQGSMKSNGSLPASHSPVTPDAEDLIHCIRQACDALVGRPGLLGMREWTAAVTQKDHLPGRVGVVLAQLLLEILAFDGSSVLIDIPGALQVAID